MLSHLVISGHEESRTCFATILDKGAGKLFADGKNQLKNDADPPAATHLIITTNNTYAKLVQIQWRTVRFSGEGR